MWPLRLLFLIGLVSVSIQGSMLNKAYRTQNGNIRTSERDDVKRKCGPWVFHPYFWLMSNGYFGREDEQIVDHHNHNNC